MIRMFNLGEIRILNMSEESLESNIIFKLKNQNVLNSSSLKLLKLKFRHYTALLASLGSLTELEILRLWIYLCLKPHFVIFWCHLEVSL